MNQIVALKGHASEDTIRGREDVSAAFFGVLHAVFRAVAYLLRRAGLQPGAVNIAAQADLAAPCLLDLADVHPRHRVDRMQGVGSCCDKLIEKGASCYIINPYKFRIIKDSWNKTDKQDSRNMAKALWVHAIAGEFGLPVVYKPRREVRELRRLFSVYASLNKHLIMLKNSVQSILTENGMVLSTENKRLLLSKKTGMSLLEKLDISDASRISVKLSLELLWKVQEQKEQLAKEIFYAGKPFEKEVKLLISIKGITPLSALAFLSDVGDVRRFKTTRKMNAYLGLVPKLKESGDVSRVGHINRASRKTTRTLLTQSLVQAMSASPYLKSYYEQVKDRRGAGRGRIALIRKLCGIMRRMLLTGEQFREVNMALYQKKVRQYNRIIKNLEEEKRSA